MTATGPVGPMLRRTVFHPTLTEAWTVRSLARRLIGLGALAVAFGCAAPSGTVVRDPGVVTLVTADGQTWQLHRGVDVILNQQLTVGGEAAWSALLRVYERLEIEPDILVSSQRRLGASEHRFSRRILGRPASDFFECGLDPGLERPLADQVPIQAMIVTEVVERPSGAELRTTVQGRARRSGGAAGTAECQSRGLLEVLIARMTQEMAGGSPGHP